MLEIGINEGWKLAPSKMADDKKSFELNFAKGKVSNTAMELFDSEEESESSRVLLFAPKVVDRKGVKRGYMDIAGDLKLEYNRLYYIFKLYFTKDELKTKFPPSVIYEGTGINDKNQEAILTSQAKVDQMFENICNAASKLIVDEKMNDLESFRVKMYRQSDDKAFPRLTYKPEYDNWIELMSVPKELSVVKWTAYEISKGFDNALPKEADRTAAPPKNNAFTEGNTIHDDIPESPETAGDKLPFD